MTVCGAILGVGFELLEIFGVRFGVERSKSGFRALTSQKNGRTGCEPRMVSGGFSSTGSGFRALTSHKNERTCCEPKMASRWFQRGVQAQNKWASCVDVE